MIEQLLPHKKDQPSKAERTISLAVRKLYLETMPTNSLLETIMLFWTMAIMIFWAAADEVVMRR